MGDVYLYTGKGAGKTTNILGLALRSVGHGQKVIIIQFLKWWKRTGEYKIRKRLAPEYEIYMFGRRGWHGLKKLGPRDRALCYKGLAFARKVVKEKKPRLLGLDELNLAVHTRMLDLKDVLAFLDEVPEGTDVVITGRHAPKKLMQRADFVNRVDVVKMPKKMKARPGIQY